MQIENGNRASVDDAAKGGDTTSTVDGFFDGCAKLGRAVFELFRGEPVHDFTEESPSLAALSLLDDKLVALSGEATFKGYTENPNWPMAVIIRPSEPVRYGVHDLEVTLQGSEEPVSIKAYIEDENHYEKTPVSLVGRLSTDANGALTLEEATLW